MFCCFRGDTAIPADPSVASSVFRRSQQQDCQNGSLSAQRPKAATRVDSVTSPSGERSTRDSRRNLNGCGPAKDGAALEQHSVPAARPVAAHRVWFDLVEGLKNDASKCLSATGTATGRLSSDADCTELRLAPGGSAMSLADLLQQVNALPDPVAVLLFDRTPKRTVRTRRVSPHLIMDINIEALFAGGVVPPPPSMGQQSQPGCPQQGQQGGEAGGAGGGGGGYGTASSQALLHLLQRVYCSAEAIRLSVMHGNPALLSLMGCSGPSEYEALLSELLSREHVLRAMLHDCCLCMLEGVAATSSQLMVQHNIRGLSSRVIMPIAVHPVLIWRRPPEGAPMLTGPHPGVHGPGGPAESHPAMAVVFRYTLSAGLQTALMQLHRVYAMLSSLPGIVTLFTLRGRVLHQNAASIRYMGLRQGLGGLAHSEDGRPSTDPNQQMMDGSGLSRGSILRQMFALSGDQLDDMLEDVVEGKTWKGIVRVPPLLTPTIDPGPMNAAVLAARGTIMSTYTSASQVPEGTSQGQVLTTWERLGPVLMSTQPGNRGSAAQAVSEAEVNSDLHVMPSALLNTQTEQDKSTGTATGNGVIGGPMGQLGGLAAASGVANGGGAGMRGGPNMAMMATQGDGSTPDSCIFLAMGSTNGTTFSRLHNVSHLGTQSSSVRNNLQRAALAANSSTDLTAESHAALAAALCCPTTPPTVPPTTAGGGLHPVRSKLGEAASAAAAAAAASASAATVASGGGGTSASGASAGGGPGIGGGAVAASAPVVPSNPRAQSAVRMAGTSLLRTLMENGNSIMSEMDAASVTVGTAGPSGGGGGGTGGGGAGSGNSPGGTGLGLPNSGSLNLTGLGIEDPRLPRPPGLTDAARRSIVRRRSALKLLPSDDNPLSTSTWGLLEGARPRHESKSFSVRRNGPSTFKRGGTDTWLDRNALGTSLPESAAAGASSLHSAGNGGTITGAMSGGAAAAAAAGLLNCTGSGFRHSSGSKRRPPSRLMSFLANKNIGASSKSLGNNVWSASITEGTGAAGRDFAGGAASNNKAISSTTELEIASRMGSSLGAHAASVMGMAGSGTGGGAAGGQQTLQQQQQQPALPPSAQLAAVMVGTSAQASSPSPRRPPARRLLRPAIEDVAEESGAENSGRLHSAAAAATTSVPAGGGSGAGVAGVLPNLSSVYESRASTASQGPAAGGGAAGSGSQQGVQQLRPSLGDSLSAMRGSTAPSPLLNGSERGSLVGDDEDDCWHEITTSTLRDPVSGEQTLLLMQVDVSARVRAERRIAEVLEAEHKLLESVFPRHVLEMAAAQHTKDASGRHGPAVSKFSLAELPLAQNCASVATYHPMVTILFSDIIGFTSMCHEIPATKVMQFLNNLYSRLDSLLDVYGVYKVETIGDCYMVAGGLMTRDADGFMTVRGSGSLDELHAAKVMAFAKAMLRETAEVLLPTTGRPVQMRIGLHSGPVMSGIVGSKMPRFCLFGDTVNTASRMESTCPPGCIHVSVATREFLPDEDWGPTGGVNVKGKGVMETFRWVPLEDELSPQGRPGGHLHGGHHRHNRPRRASSVAYIQTGGQTRDMSSSIGNVGGYTSALAWQVASGVLGAAGGGGGGGGFGFGGFGACAIGSGGQSSASAANSNALLQAAGQATAAALISAAAAATAVGGGGGGGTDNSCGSAGLIPFGGGKTTSFRAASATVGFAATSVQCMAGADTGAMLGTGAVSGTGVVSGASAMSGCDATLSGGGGGAGPPSGFRVGAGSGNLTSGAGGTLRRKPHRTCSATALAYRGVGVAKAL